MLESFFEEKICNWINACPWIMHYTTTTYKGERTQFPPNIDAVLFYKLHGFLFVYLLWIEHHALFLWHIKYVCMKMFRLMYVIRIRICKERVCNTFKIFHVLCLSKYKIQTLMDSFFSRMSQILCLVVYRFGLASFQSVSDKCSDKWTGRINKRKKKRPSEPLYAHTMHKFQHEIDWTHL